MNLHGAHALVTGGASFIGSHLVDALLEKGAKVRVVDDLSSGKLENIQQHIDNSKVEFIKADLHDTNVCTKSLDGIDIVFHLAADHGGRGYVDLHQIECARNLRLDQQILELAAKHGVKNFVFASSGCVYPNYKQEDVNEELYLTEKDVGPPYDADNMYGWAKLMTELTLKEYCKKGLLKGCSLRYFTVYGPRGKEDHAVMAMIARAFIRQSPFEVWGDGTQIRNWTHVHDIVRGTIRAAEKIEDGTAINLGTKERTSVLDAVNHIAHYVQQKYDPAYAPSIVKQPHKPTGPKNRVADNTLANQLLGADWQQIPFKDGLKGTLDWYFSTKNREDVASIFAQDRLTER